MGELEAFLNLNTEEFFLYLWIVLAIVVFLNWWIKRVPIGSHLVARVTWVCDGDTLKVKRRFREFRVRLAGIDAPEGDQEFGDISREVLMQFVANKTVKLHIVDKDHWGRYVAFVRVGTTDVNLEMIRRGVAWAYRQYFRNLSRKQRYEYSNAEREAKQKRIGIWSQTNKPVEPWEHRRETRSLGTWLHFLWLKIINFLFGKRNSYKRHF